MSSSLDDLCDSIRSRAEHLILRAQGDLGFPVRLLETIRTPETQAHYATIGVSRTSTKSKHLPQPSCNKSHAFDVVPVHLMRLKNWAPGHPDWLRLGELGESLGLDWGGRWSGRWHLPGTRDYHFTDCPHFDVKVVHLNGVRQA